MYARLKVSIYIIMCVLDHHYCTHYTLPLHKLYRIICMGCDNIYVFFPQRIDAVALIVRRSIVSYAFRFDDVSCSLAGSRRLAICGTWTRLVGATTATVNSRHADAFSDWKSQMRQVPERIIIFHLPQHFFFWFGFVVHASQIASAQSFAKLFNVVVAFYGDDLNVLYLCAALVFRMSGRNDKQSVSIAAIHSAYEMVEAASMSLRVRAPATPKIPFSIEINALFCVNQRHTLTPKCLHTFLSFLNIIIIFYPIFLLLGEMSACACSVQQHSHTQYSLACCCLACFSPTFPRTLVENAL